MSFLSYNLNRTNRVDVLGDDDVFRIGRVVDVADNGLFEFVDFFCPNRRRELTPFNRIFRNVDCESSQDALALAYVDTEPGKPTPVDVLVPETPSGPWAWVPGLIVNVARPVRPQAHVSTVVHWVNDVACTDVVPLERLRWTVNSEWWATIGRNASVRHDGVSTTHGLSARLDPVEAGTFHKRSLLLSGAEDWRHVDVDKLVQRLHERVCRREEYRCRYVSFVDIADGCVSYVWRYLPFLGCPTTGPFPNISLYPDPVQNFIRKCDGALVAGIRAIILQLTEEITSITEPEDSSDIGLLTVDVLLEVFSQLDTRTQTGLRTVCFTWNAVLESPVLTAGIVIIGFGSHHYRPYRPQLHYFLTSPVFKCFRQSTQHIVVDASNSFMNAGDIVTLTDVIHYVGRKIGCQLRTFHIVGLQCELAFTDPPDNEDYGSDRCLMHRYANGIDDVCRFSVVHRLVDFIAACGGLPCAVIHLVNCEMDLIYAKIHFRKKIQLAVHLVDIRFPMNDDMGCVMWDMLEKSVPLQDGKQLETLSAWLQAIAADKKGRRCEERGLACRVMTIILMCTSTEVLRALCATQTADPRPSSHYRGKVWCEDGLQGLQLEKLSPVALHFLVELAQYWTMWNINNHRWYYGW